MVYFCKNIVLKRSLLTYFFIILSFLHGFAQDSVYQLPNQSFYEFLWNERFEGCRLNTNQQQVFRFIDFKTSKWKNYGQQLLISNNRLFIHLLGSGIVYGSIRDKSGQIAMRRLDSTEHFGYNINSYSFTAAKKIYNLGGYGMWRWNGQLRVFHEPTQQWEIEPVNEELAVSCDFPGAPLWISGDQKRLISLGFLKGNQAVQGNQNQKVMLESVLLEMNLDDFTWIKKGQITSEVIKWIKPEMLLLSLNSGLLFSNFGLHYLLDLNDFTVKELINRDIQNLLLRKRFNTVNWNKGDTVYFGNINSGIIDSIDFKSSYFRITNEKVFLKPVNTTAYIISIGLIFVLLSFTAFLKYKRRRITMQNSDVGLSIKSETILSSPYRGSEVFDAVEQSLLTLLMDNAAQMGKRTGTEEVNRVLGVAQKSMDMQKRKRSDVIRSINAKYKLINHSTTLPLVDRVKSDLDARLYEYYLLQEEIEQIQKILSDQKKTE